jgi:glutaredoxin
MYLVLGRDNCSYCDAAVSELESSGEEFQYFDVMDAQNWRLRDLLVQDLKVTQVPQIFELVGGYDSLAQKLGDEGKYDN